MKDYFLTVARAVAVAAIIAAASMLGGHANAQVVTQLPIYIDNNGPVLDLGNGPLEIRILQGSAGIATSQGSGIGSGTTTAITLTATPAVPPCIGCGISGSTLGPTSIVTAFNGTTGITTNTSQTIPASSPLAWGAACPATLAGVRTMLLQPLSGGVQNDTPLYTTGRICAGSQFTAGATAVVFPIGAH